MRIALVGNQNCGKTTLFNLLTGMNQKIGNWPGVTIEKKIGTIKGSNHELIDLPGIYSMSSYTSEEKISRDFILNKECDLIVNVIDVTCIERSLYLTTQLMECDVPIVIVLNMADLLIKKGIEVDVAKLEKELGVEVTKVSALKGIGVAELKESFKKAKIVRRKIFDNDIENIIKEMEEMFETNKRFNAIKVIEKDEMYANVVGDNKLIVGKLEKKYGKEMDSIIANKRYCYIERIKNKCFVYKEVKESINEKLDRFFLNKWLALPIFVIIMFAVYYLSVGVVGSATVDLIDGLVGNVGEKLKIYLESIGVSSWLISLIVNGIVAGVGAILNFIPQLIILFLCISILETCGYMSRIAFFLDVIFRKIGLSGKSLVPFIVGSGCSVPGIMATRTIENNEEREMSVVLTPFIPCSAKLPIIALFSEYFFPSKSGLVSASLYFLAIMVIIVLSLVLKKYVYKGVDNSFISELPEYKIPSIKYVFKDVFDKVISFIKRAGSIILISSIIIWFLLSFSFKFEYGVSIENSILASIGKCFSWVFYPMLGELSWGATVSAIQGLVAKEQVVSSMAIIANMSEMNLNSSTLFSGSVFGFFTGVSAYSYVVFNLFSAPCFGAIGAMKRELGSIKKTMFAVALQCVVAWIIAVLIYIVGTIIVGG